MGFREVDLQEEFAFHTLNLLHKPAERLLAVSCWVSFPPPVPSPTVKSPPWIMKSLMTLWNFVPL